MTTLRKIDSAAATLWASAFVIMALIIVAAGQRGGNAAYAGNADTRGDYSALTVNAGLGGGEQPYELLYVLDSRDEVLLVYDMDDARKGLVLRTGGSLANVFQAARPR